MVNGIQNLSNSLQSLGQSTLQNLQDPNKISEHEAAWAFQHFMVISLVHQIMKSLQQYQHRFKDSS